MYEGKTLLTPLGVELGRDINIKIIKKNMYVIVKYLVFGVLGMSSDF